MKNFKGIGSLDTKLHTSNQRTGHMVLQESWSGLDNVFNLLCTIWGTSYLNGCFEAKPQGYCIPKESEREIRPPY